MFSYKEVYNKVMWSNKGTNVRIKLIEGKGEKVK